MADTIDRDRRRFLGAAGLAIGAAQFGLYRAVNGEVSDDTALMALDGAVDWLNSRRLTAAGLAGKIVLIQFCTYTCINWLRTLPYIRAWGERYREHVVVIGVHTPEFSFERNIDNVRRAVHRLRLEYPLVIDNDFRIWRAFNNRYWPALYFVDGHGQVRQSQFGEGKYENAERNIQRLLTEGGVTQTSESVLSASGTGVEAAPDWANLRSPENYLGYARTENFASPGGLERNRSRLYALPGQFALNEWALAGEWTVAAEAVALSAATGRLACRFHARDLHLVMGAFHEGTAGRFRVSIDGKPPGAAHGADVDDSGQGIVKEPRLYQVIRQAAPIGDRQFEIEFLDGGVRTFAFTFG